MHAHAQEESRTAPHIEDFLDNMWDIYILRRHAGIFKCIKTIIYEIFVIVNIKQGCSFPISSEYPQGI